MAGIKKQLQRVVLTRRMRIVVECDGVFDSSYHVTSAEQMEKALSSIRKDHSAGNVMSH